jgi:hypothetical protein
MSMARAPHGSARPLRLPLYRGWGAHLDDSLAQATRALSASLQFAPG